MLRARVTQILGKDNIDEALRTYTRYCCRLCGAQEISKLAYPRARTRELKAWLDHSTYRNILYRALWALCQCPSSPDYRSVAADCQIDPDELQYLYGLLSEADRHELLELPRPGMCSPQDVEAVLDALQGHIKNQARWRLRYCWANDDAHSLEDFCADLTCHAIKVLRNYEVLNLTPKQLIPLVSRGVSNHAKNLASFHGKASRNPLRRLQRRAEVKPVWYCNVRRGVVEQVKVYSSLKFRQGDYCVAAFPDGRMAYVYVYRLHETEEEAKRYLRNYVAGKESKRHTVIDLSSSHQDDWIPTTVSLDTPSDPDATPLSHYLATDNLYTPAPFSIEGVKNPRVREFFYAMSGDLGPLFEDYCRKRTGRPSTELTDIVLGRVAKRYCRVTKKELTAALQSQI